MTGKNIWIQTPDLKLAARAWGPADGKPVLGLHGWLDNAASFDALAPMLEDIRLVALDFPGHGWSDHRPHNSWYYLADYTADIQRVAAALGWDRFSLLGHSLGGGCALSLGLDQPGRTASLTLICPVGLGREINETDVTGFIAANRRKEMKAVLTDLFADANAVTRDMVNDVLKYKRIDGVEGALNAIAQEAFPGGVQSVSFRDRLTELSVPVQVIWGDADRILPSSHAANLPEPVSVHVIDGGGHMVHMEKAAEVNALIEENLAAAA